MEYCQLENKTNLLANLLNFTFLLSDFFFYFFFTKDNLQFSFKSIFC